MTISRREFLIGGAGVGASVLAQGVLPSQAYAAGANDVLVCVFLRGGADAINLVVPYGDGDYYANRNALAIAKPGSGANAGLDLDGFFAFHPAAAPLLGHFQNRTLAVVHAVGSPDPTRSHFDAQDYMERGRPGVKTELQGWIGRHLASSGAALGAFSALGLGAHAQTSLNGPTAPLALNSIDSFRLWAPTGSEGFLSSLYQGDNVLSVAGQEALAALASIKAIAVAPHPPLNGAVYPNNTFGRQMADVATLIRRNIGVKAACVDLLGWDTHNYQGGATGAFANVLTTLAGGLNAFVSDMGEGMAGVTVVVMTEFGRRVKENGSGGTDHGHGGVMLALGPNVNGGRIYGTWPSLAAAALDHGDLAITTDYRSVLGELVQKRLGNANLDAVFPGFSVQPLGVFKG